MDTQTTAQVLTNDLAKAQSEISGEELEGVSGGANCTVNCMTVNY